MFPLRNLTWHNGYSFSTKQDRGVTRVINSWICIKNISRLWNTLCVYCGLFSAIATSATLLNANLRKMNHRMQLTTWLPRFMIVLRCHWDCLGTRFTCLDLLLSSMTQSIRVLWLKNLKTSLKRYSERSNQRHLYDHIHTQRCFALMCDKYKLPESG